ncbi:MAG: flavin reductase family protein [Actinomycetota bacterium]|nr:flavin reductase family protein [Actinomycetota bacterium]
MTLATDPALFRETLGHYPTGVVVVTAIDDGGTPTGMVVGSFSSVSLDPPLIAFFPATSSFSFDRLRTASAFCVNVLAADQEPLCRQLAGGGEKKFEGVRWRPGPLGSPVLDGAVSWIECTFSDVREAGDHFIVLGLVHTLAVERSTLPLLFFQGGYGRFAPGSFVATPDPELIAAAQLAESIRPSLEALSEELAVNCSVVARIGWDAVQVLAANRSPVAEPFPLGHRQPLIPPFGAVFLADAPANEVDEWFRRARVDCDVGRAHLQRVRERGYSMLLDHPATHRRHHEALAAFEAADRLPRHERAVTAATSELADLFCPDLDPARRYDLANLVVPVPTAAGQPSIALRMTGLPAAASTMQIHHWIDRLRLVATTKEN